MRSSLELANEILESLKACTISGFVAPWILSEKIEKIQDEAFAEGSKCKTCREPLVSCSNWCN